MHPLGGIDLRLILLAYAGLITTAFFMIALAIWVSTRATNVRVARAASIVWWIAWLSGPFFVSMVFPSIGIRLPRFVLTVNAWVLTSSPHRPLFKIAGGVTPSSGLLYAVAWMSGLQIAGGALLVIWAIARLRSAYRVNVSGDSQSVAARLTRPGWRWRPKPAVGDDPILWREMHTARAGLLGKAVGLVIYLGIYGILTYFTFFFARPALIEVWHHGYRSGITSAERPEWNLMVRFFMSGAEVNPPADLARTEFNLYLRFITTPLVFLITLFAAGNGRRGDRQRAGSRDLGQLDRHAAVRARHPAKQHAGGPLADARDPGDTARPLDDRSGRGGHPSCRLSRFAARRGRLDLVDAGVWNIHLDCGERQGGGELSLHGTLFPHDRHARSSLPSAGNVEFGPSGAGSPPFVAWLSLVSYRDVRNAWQYSVYPALQWMHIDTARGALSVAATCLIGIIIPTVWGLYLWRDALANFDRLIGRPARGRKRRAASRSCRELLGCSGPQ